MPALLMDGLSEVADRVRRSTVQVEGRGRGAGSGVVWRADGLVVTNAHVLRGGGGAQVSLSGGRRLRATVAAVDRQLDLALLQTDARDLPAANIGDSDALRVGELVFAVGSPYGHPGVVTVGIVHSGETRRWIQSDVRLAPGNSGGPLADAEGRVIGINTMVVNRLGLSIPSNIVDRFVARRGRPARRLGVTVQPVDAGGFGLLILEIEPGGPAHNAGLRVGDVLTGVAGTRFQAPFDLALSLEAAGRGIVFNVLRGGQPINSQVDFELQPVGAEVG
jgi:serine protease Do